MKLPVKQHQDQAVPVPEKKKFTLKALKPKRAIALTLVCAIAIGGGIYFLGGKQNSAAAAGVSYVTAQVQRQNITATITGSGSLQAANSYSVTTLLEGNILSADFEEGDQVEEGTVLFTIDSSDSSSSLEQARISMEQAQRNYNRQLENKGELNITAPAGGQIYSLDVAVGDEVKAGATVATLRNADTMTLELNFPADEAQRFYPGQSASVTLDSTFETLNGTVTKVSATTTVLTGNVQVRTVTIDVENPGGLSTQQKASAAVDGVASADSAAFDYSQEKTITAQVSGTVDSLSVDEGDRVSKGDSILKLTSDDLDDAVQSASESLRNAQLSLDKQTDKLGDYTITSPISGTIIDKNYKAGETSEANKALCTIYDLSYLTMTLNVDELDISDIQVGQTVSITADAVDGRVYQGVVTKVSVAGTTASGVTTYPVTIRIDETDGLMPGMNVDATIVLASASNVLTIPTGALQRGNTVLVTADSPSAANGTPVENRPGDDQEEQTGESYVSVPVTVGVSDDNNMEILSGLQEGDTVAYIPTNSSGGGYSMVMGSISMAGGMPGTMPSGGGRPGGF